MNLVETKGTRAIGCAARRTPEAKSLVNIIKYIKTLFAIMQAEGERSPRLWNVAYEDKKGVLYYLIIDAEAIVGDC